MLQQNLLRTLFVFLILFAGEAAAESVYVIDVLRVGIRAQPTGSGPSEAVVKSGDRLEVLEKQGQYWRVRNGDGEEGWVNRGYLVDEPPAALQLTAVQQDNGQLRREIESLKAKRGDEGREIDVLQQKIAEQSETLAAARQESAELKVHVETLASSRKGVLARYRWAFELLAALLLLGIGLYFGRCSYRCRLRRRFGGMEI